MASTDSGSIIESRMVSAAVFTDDTTAANMTDVLVPVNLTVTRRQQPPLGLERMAHSFTATPDIASSPAAAALMPTNTTMFVGQPASNGSDPSSTGPRPATHEVGFVLNAEGDRSTPVSASMRLGGFLIIERRFVYVRDEDHVIYYALFCGLPSKDNPAIWTIQWNVTNDVPERAAGLPVMLRTDKPAKGSKPGNGWGTKCLTRDF
ncbi:hypothetical protein V8F20_009384 [Naviculisporaceae sp. PSN 640]